MILTILLIEWWYPKMHQWWHDAILN